MQCTYMGNYENEHKTIKKRRLIGPAKELALDNVIEKGKSSETFREEQAVQLMKSGSIINYLYLIIYDFLILLMSMSILFLHCFIFYKNLIVFNSFLNNMLKGFIQE